MKSNLDKHFARFALLVSHLCVICASVVNSPAQDFKTIHDGVEHAKVIRKLGDDPVRINLLRLDLKKVRLDVHHAMDAAIGTEKTSSIAMRHGAVSAINAGFFRLDNSPFRGEAAGLLVIDGQLLSEAFADRTALRIINRRNSTETFMRPLGINVSLGSFASPFQISLSGINRVRNENELVLYSEKFGPTAVMNPNGIDVVLSRCKKKKRVQNERLIFCERVEITYGARGSNIPRAGYVLQISPGDFEAKKVLLSALQTLHASKAKSKQVFLKYEDRLDRSSYLPDEGEDIIAGVPQLIKNGKIDITWEQEKASKSFVETRHPRTAVAKLKDGKFLMITVDGRQSGASVGMNLNELAEYLLSLGAVDAMNLDGGGSTTMFLDGKVVNKPSDKEGERKVSDAILVTLRKKK